MTEAQRMLKKLYKKRAGKELTLGEIKEATRTMLRFVRALAASESTPQRDKVLTLLSCLDEHQVGRIQQLERLVA